MKQQPATSNDAEGQSLLTAVGKQAEVVRDLKASKAQKASIEAAVAELLALKVFVLISSSLCFEVLLSLG